MIKQINKTKELPTSKLKTFFIENKDEAENVANGNEAYLLPVKDGFYLFVMEGGK